MPSTGHKHTKYRGAKVAAGLTAATTMLLGVAYFSNASPAAPSDSSANSAAVLEEAAPAGDTAGSAAVTDPVSAVIPTVPTPQQTMPTPVPQPRRRVSRGS